MASQPQPLCTLPISQFAKAAYKAPTSPTSSITPQRHHSTDNDDGLSDTMSENSECVKTVQNTSSNHPLTHPNSQRGPLVKNSTGKPTSRGVCTVFTRFFYQLCCPNSAFLDFHEADDQPNFDSPDPDKNINTTTVSCKTLRTHATFTQQFSLNDETAKASVSTTSTMVSSSTLKSTQHCSYPDAGGGEHMVPMSGLHELPMNHPMLYQHLQTSSSGQISSTDHALLFGQDAIASSELFSNLHFVQGTTAAEAHETSQTPPDSQLQYYDRYTPALSIIAEETESQLDLYFTQFSISRTSTRAQHKPHPGAFFKKGSTVGSIAGSSGSGHTYSPTKYHPQASVSSCS